MFIVSYAIDVDEKVIHSIEGMDMVVLGGYYIVFGRGLYKAEKKTHYFKQHWIMAIFLMIPFLPFARVMHAMNLQRVFSIGTNTLWHFFDRIGML